MWAGRQFDIGQVFEKKQPVAGVLVRFATGTATG